MAKSRTQKPASVARLLPCTCDPDGRLRRVPRKELERFQGNAKTLHEEQYTKLKAAMEAKGFIAPIFIWAGHAFILDGHQRLNVLDRENWDVEGGIPVVEIEAADEKDAAEKLLLLSSTYGKVDPQGLYEFTELHGIKLSEFTLPDLPDFDLAKFTAEYYTDLTVLAGPDDVPEPPVEPVTRTGDLWLLGEHRVLCGDSTRADDVAQVMGGAKASVLNTDPPYGVAYDNAKRPNPGVAKPRVANDEMVDGPSMQAFLERMLHAAAPHMDDHAAYYFWHPMLTQGTYVAAAAAAGILIHRQIIWVKPVLLLGRGDYHWKHELCFYGWKQGYRPPFYGERNQHTVWEIASVSQAARHEYNHATPKPVELFTRPIQNHTKPGGCLYEPFCGSGPQIIACEQLGRQCMAMDVVAAYVDVSVRRWQNFTGKAATLDGDDRTFAEIAQERGHDG